MITEYKLKGVCGAVLGQCAFGLDLPFALESDGFSLNHQLM